MNVQEIADQADMIVAGYAFKILTKQCMLLREH